MVDQAILAAGRHVRFMRVAQAAVFQQDARVRRRLVSAVFGRRRLAVLQVGPLVLEAQRVADNGGDSAHDGHAASRHLGVVGAMVVVEDDHVQNDGQRRHDHEEEQIGG